MSSPAAFVTVMIPAYNQAGFVARAIRSAAEQDHPNLEIVVADDCSSDNTAEVARDAIAAMPGLNARVVHHEENLGILRNYHETLFNHARGDWVVNLDADDYFVDRGFISAAMAMAESDPAIALVFADYREVQDATGSAIAIRNAGLPAVLGDAAFFDRYAKGGIRWNHNAIVYRRAEALRVGCYWQQGELRNDWESFLRLIVGSKVAHLPREVAAWVQHGSNETRRLDLRKYLDNFVMIENTANYATSAGMDRQFVAAWTAQMKRLSAVDSCGAYAGSRDFSGMIEFLRRAPVPLATRLRLLLSPGNAARLLLGRGSAPYRFIKKLLRTRPESASS